MSCGNPVCPNGEEGLAAEKQGTCQKAALPFCGLLQERVELCKIRRRGGGSLFAYTHCMLCVLCGAFTAVEPDLFLAASLASAFWKVCAAKAKDALASGQGAGAFRSALLDAASTLETGEFARLTRAEML